MLEYSTELDLGQTRPQNPKGTSRHSPVGTKARANPSIVTGLDGYRSYPMLKGDPILGIRELAVNRIQFTVMGNPPLSDMTTK